VRRSKQQTADSKQQATNENADPLRVGEFVLGAWFPGGAGPSALKIEDFRSQKIKGRVPSNDHSAE